MQLELNIKAHWIIGSDSFKQKRKKLTLLLRIMSRRFIQMAKGSDNYCSFPEAKMNQRRDFFIIEMSGNVMFGISNRVSSALRLSSEHAKGCHF